MEATIAKSTESLAVSPLTINDLVDRLTIECESCGNELCLCCGYPEGRPKRRGKSWLEGKRKSTGELAFAAHCPAKPVCALILLLRHIEVPAAAPQSMDIPSRADVKGNKYNKSAGVGTGYSGQYSNSDYAVIPATKSSVPVVDFWDAVLEQTFRLIASLWRLFPATEMKEVLRNSRLFQGMSA